jgi:hypothetical protein
LAGEIRYVAPRPSPSPAALKPDTAKQGNDEASAPAAGGKDGQ